jgi:membrane protease YdiL (CAAX protease family)
MVFSLAILSRQIVFSWPWYLETYNALPEVIQWLEQPVRWTSICLLAIILVQRIPVAAAIDQLGLISPVGRGMLMGFLASLPLVMIPLAFGTVPQPSPVLETLFLAGVWPLAEEILFRGYAVGQLVRRAGLALWPAAVLSGLLFGLVHLGQASVRRLPLEGEIATVLIVSVGGVLFAWLFVTWGLNLWVPFSLHAFMNLWWHIFDLADSPLGGLGANVARLLTVVLAVCLTSQRHRIPVLRRQRGDNSPLGS